MTRNAKMTWPGEMQTETFAPTGPNVAQARKRMNSMCATPAEVEMYKYEPNGARNNLHPGIPDPSYDQEFDD